MLLEAQSTSGNYLKPTIKEGAMRVASLVVCDIIEKLKSFGEIGEEKPSILVFLPGFAEIF